MGFMCAEEGLPKCAPHLLEQVGFSTNLSPEWGQPLQLASWGHTATAAFSMGQSTNPAFRTLLIKG